MTTDTTIEVTGMSIFAGQEFAIAMSLSVLLGVSLGIMGSGVYANRRVRRIMAGLDNDGTILQQLAHERAIYINELVDAIAELKRVHSSAGGLVRKMEDLKRSIDASVNDTTPIAPLRDLRLTASATRAG